MAKKKNARKCPACGDGDIYGFTDGCPCRTCPDWHTCVPDMVKTTEKCPENAFSKPRCNQVFGKMSKGNLEVNGVIWIMDADIWKNHAPGTAPKGTEYIFW